MEVNAVELENLVSQARGVALLPEPSQRFEGLNPFLNRLYHELRKEVDRFENARNNYRHDFSRWSQRRR